MNDQLKKGLAYTVATVFFFAVVTGLLFFEQQGDDSNIKTFSDALWYTLVTLTTVGYGDFYPTTVGGKLIGIFVVIGSIGVLGYIIGKISGKITEYMEQKKQGHFGTSFTDHFIIIGWDDFGRQVADQIVKSKNRVAIVTNKKDDVDLIAELYPKEYAFTLFTDFHNYQGLEKVNIEKATKTFVNFTDDTETLIYIINLKKHYQNLDFVVMVNSQELKETFNSIGATYIISKNEIASRLVASYIFEPDVATFTEDLMATSITGDDYDILEYRVTESNPFNGKQYMDAFVDLKMKYDCVLMGISKNENNQLVLYKNPGKGMTVNTGDYLIIMSNGVAKKDVEATFGVIEGRN